MKTNMASRGKIKNGKKTQKMPPCGRNIDILKGEGGGNMITMQTL